MLITYIVEMREDERNSLLDVMDIITKLQDEMEQFETVNDEFDFLGSVAKDLERVLYNYSK